MGADRTHCLRLAANFVHSLVREPFENCFLLRITVWSRPSSLTTNAWDVVMQGTDCYPQTHLPIFHYQLPGCGGVMTGGVPLVTELNSGRRGQSFPFTGLPGLGVLGMTETKHGPGWRHSVSNAPSRTQAKQSITPPPHIPSFSVSN